MVLGGASSLLSILGALVQLAVTKEKITAQTDSGRPFTALRLGDGSRGSELDRHADCFA